MAEIRCLMMLTTLILVFALFAVLLNRLGAFRRLHERREAERFEAEVLQLGEEVAWKDHMQRMDRRLPAIHRLPTITLK